MLTLVGNQTMRSQIKKALNSLGLLKFARAIIYWLTQFDPETTNPRRLTIRFYSQFIHVDDLCFDVGANLGQRTDIFLELGAKTICIEPQSFCLKKLSNLYGDKDSITIVGKGVSSVEGEMEMFICEELSSLSTMSSSWQQDSIHAKEYGYQWNKKETVEVTTLDALIAQYGLPTFCKIDVEGFEYEVLSGLNHPIPLISFEFNDGFFDETRKCIVRLLQLGNYKFNFGLAEPSGGQGLFLDEWSVHTVLYEQIESLSKSTPKLWGDIYAKLF